MIRDCYLLISADWKVVFQKRLKSLSIVIVRLRISISILVNTGMANVPALPTGSPDRSWLIGGIVRDEVSSNSILVPFSERMGFPEDDSDFDYHCTCLMFCTFLCNTGWM